MNALVIAELTRLAQQFEQEAASLRAGVASDNAYLVGVCYALEQCAKAARARATELRGSGEHPG